VKLLDQTRGWFYSLLAISGLVFDSIQLQERGLPGVDTGWEGQKNVPNPVGTW
jgi:isoleucyl-tRNA synthetase